MIRLNKLTDYGIVLMAQIASQDRLSNASELSAKTALPLPMVSKVLKALSRSGLLVSHRGVKGGYGLARPSAEISVADVITALDGPIAITECADEQDECSYEASCSVRGNWQRINQAVKGALERIPLSEMASHNEIAGTASQVRDLVSLGR